jgi:ATP-dependent RNA helicase RhlE
VKTEVPFSKFELSPPLISALERINFTHASDVQELTIDPIIEGQDIFVQAKTGSGKTGAFAIPIVELLLRNENEQGFYLVISPTRELAQQTFSLFEQLGEETAINSICLIGGENIDRQKELLSKGVSVIVGTPGRLNDLLSQKMIPIKTCAGVVLDEADRLFDMGFKDDIQLILKQISTSRQLIMLSATNNIDVLNIAYQFHSQPLEIKIGTDELVVDKIDHKIAMISKKEKMPLLVNILKKNPDVYAMIFCNTQYQTHLVAEWLCSMGFKAKPISGRLPQNKRTRLMEDFREKKTTILVCTDVAARGLDIKDLTLVINYDLPQDAANYVHRIGRTGRAGKSGEAISFCAHEDCGNFDAIHDLVGKIESLDLDDDDFAQDVTARPNIDKKTLRLVENNKSNRREKSSRRERGGAQEDVRRKVQRNERRDTELEKDTVRTPKKPITYIVSTSSLKTATAEAKDYFRLEDEGLLGSEVLEKGKRKFIFFGPRQIKYKFFVRPIYKRLLTPFFIELINKMKLKLHVRVSYKDNNLRISFSGQDEKLLMRNQAELLAAFEQLARGYLARKIVMPRNLRISVRCHSGNRNNKGDEKYLLDLAKKLKQEVLDNQAPVTSKFLNAAERRIIHQFFQDDPQFKTNSIGDGRLKKIEVSLG